MIQVPEAIVAISLILLPLISALNTIGEVLPISLVDISVYSILLVPFQIAINLPDLILFPSFT